MREGFRAALLQLGERDDFLVLTGDHGYALFDEYRDKYPDKFFNVGVSEANMVTMAAGLAREGLNVLIYGLASFVPNRVYEFLKLQVALDALPVTVVGDGGGLVYSTLGHSHQSLDDIALATALPNFEVYSPSSDLESETIFVSRSKARGPAYIRLGKSGGSYLGGFPGGKIQPYVVKSSPSAKLAVLCHGFMTSRVLDLANSGILTDVDIFSVPTICPITDEFFETLSKYNKIAVVEEHNFHGGLGSAILGRLQRNSPNLKVIAATKPFHRGVGSYEWALSQKGLSKEHIVAEINNLLSIA